MCCTRAIVTAIARIERHPQWNSIRQGLTILKELATELQTRAGVPIGECGLDEAIKFQEALSEYHFHVLSKKQLMHLLLWSRGRHTNLSLLS